MCWFIGSAPDYTEAVVPDSNPSSVTVENSEDGQSHCVKRVNSRVREGSLPLSPKKHSPVIQATWEARTMEWLEKEEPLPPDRRTSVDGLRLPGEGKFNQGGKAPMMKVGQVTCCNNRSWISIPSQNQFPIMYIFVLNVLKTH